MNNSWIKPLKPIKKRKNNKKVAKNFAVKKNIHTFALAFKKHGSVAQLNRASDYGSEGCRFESCRSHKKGYLSLSDNLFCFPHQHVHLTHLPNATTFRLSEPHETSTRNIKENKQNAKILG